MATGLVSSYNINNNFELILSQNFLHLKDKNETATITVTTPSNGKIFALSSDMNKIFVSVTNNIISIKVLDYITSAIIAVGQTMGTGKYANIQPKTKNIYVINIDNILNNNSWATISAIAQQGLGSTYWSIGDTKSILLNGNIGEGFTANNINLNVFILHFNYPYYSEYSFNDPTLIRSEDNNIIFGGFKDTNNKDIALDDQYYNQASQTGKLYFNMSHWGYPGYGIGWKSSDLRYDILGAVSIAPDGYGTSHTANVGYNATTTIFSNPKANTLLAALPNDLRAVLRLWSRCLDIGDVLSGNDYVERIQRCIDAISLLAEFEVLGTNINASKYEQNYQEQMEYYRLGNSTDKNRYRSPSLLAYWWLASVDVTTSHFCIGRYTQYPDNCYSIAPAFKI